LFFKTKKVGRTDGGILISRYVSYKCIKNIKNELKQLIVLLQNIFLQLIKCLLHILLLFFSISSWCIFLLIDMLIQIFSYKKIDHSYSFNTPWRNVKIYDQDFQVVNGEKIIYLSDGNSCSVKCEVGYIYSTVYVYHHNDVYYSRFSIIIGSILFLLSQFKHKLF
jgi:hypothetical protein